jgi:putative transposase
MPTYLFQPFLLQRVVPVGAGYCHQEKALLPPSERFTGELQQRGISISMDGRGRCFDNIFIERLWRSLKQEEVYLKDYQLMSEARIGIERWFQFYNYRRPHMSLNYRTPAAIYKEGGIA